MDLFSRDKPPIRLCNKVPSRQQGRTGLLGNSRALHQDRLYLGATIEVLRWPPKKGTAKMRGCIDLRRPNERIVYEHFKMEGLHTIQQLLRRNDCITKVDLSDFYMHFLTSQADRRYMRFMWEGGKFQCISMPFGLTPTKGLATKMIAPVIRYLRSCGLRLAICIDKESIEQQRHTVGGYPTQSRLPHSSRQVFGDPLLVGRVLRHTSEQ